MCDFFIVVILFDLNIILSIIFFFKCKCVVGEECWYEKILLCYLGCLINSLKIKDDCLFKVGFREWENVMQYNILVQVIFIFFKYLQVVFLFNYIECWYICKVMKSYDEIIQKWDIYFGDMIYGFYWVFNYLVSLVLSIKMYGMYQLLFMKKKEIQICYVFILQILLNGFLSFG